MEKSLLKNLFDRSESVVIFRLLLSSASSRFISSECSRQFIVPTEFFESASAFGIKVPVEISVARMVVALVISAIISPCLKCIFSSIGLVMTAVLKFKISPGALSSQSLPGSRTIALKEYETTSN